MNSIFDFQLPYDSSSSNSCLTFLLPFSWAIGCSPWTSESTLDTWSLFPCYMYLRIASSSFFNRFSFPTKLVCFFFLIVPLWRTSRYGWSFKIVASMVTLLSDFSESDYESITKQRWLTSINLSSLVKIVFRATLSFFCILMNSSSSSSFEAEASPWRIILFSLAFLKHKKLLDKANGLRASSCLILVFKLLVEIDYFASRLKSESTRNLLRGFPNKNWNNVTSMLPQRRRPSTNPPTSPSQSRPE